MIDLCDVNYIYWDKDYWRSLFDSPPLTKNSRKEFVCDECMYDLMLGVWTKTLHMYLDIKK